MIKEKKPLEKKSLFITATNTDIGKTYASEKFLRYYHSKGFKVGYFKPIETGVKDYPLDGKKMLALTKELNPDFKVGIDDIVPYQFTLAAAPYVAKKDKKISLSYLKEKRDYLFKFCDFLIIEGAGGLMVPIEKDFYIIDLIKAFNVQTALIASSKLGGINDTLLSCMALKSYGISYECYINVFLDKDSFMEVSYPFYKECKTDIKFLKDITF